MDATTIMRTPSIRNILLVDDKPENFRLLKDILAPGGYNISYAASGEQALEMVDESSFDLVLLDVMMGGIDGFETCVLLKERDDYADVPVIFITARTDSEALHKAFESGGADFITKPVQADEVLLRVANQLHIRSLILELQMTNQSKNRFLSIISHDLRGPLGTMMHLASYPDDKPAEEADLRATLKTLRATASRTHRLLEDLLQWSHAQTGSISFFPVVVPASTLVSNTLGDFTEQAEKKGITFEIEMEEVLVKGDENMLGTVLRNLIGNALKFTKPDGRITLLAERDGDWVWFGVKDEGMGIPADKLAGLFSLDSKFVRSGTAGEVGSGLGLLLVKEFVDYHGGQLEVESDEGLGTRFRFSVPYAEQQPFDASLFVNG